MARVISQIGYRLAISRRYGKRYREIASALIRHGFGFLVVQLGLSRFVPFQYGILGHPRRMEPYTQAEHVRLIFEELGTTFIKLGQILSARTDLLAPEYIRELEKLLDSVPPADVELIRNSIRRELGQHADEIFAHFDPIPLASASIGQVHAAKLKTGEDVIVKVKRPGVEKQVLVDVDIISELARLASRQLPEGKSYDFEGIAREFIQTLMRELDYMQEGRNADIFRKNFKSDKRAYIPRIYWEYTTGDIIVIERLFGLKISDTDALVRTGLDVKALARRSSDILLKQVFEDGFFHADPHPANFFVMADGAIGILDFGMVGYLDRETKLNLVELFIAVFEQNPDGIIDSYIDLGVVGRVERFGQLRNEISALIAQYYGLSIEETDIGPVLNDVTSLIRRHNLRMPANLALLTKTIAMEEGLVMRLDPGFRFAEAMAPFAKKAWEETYSPVALATRTYRALFDFFSMGTRAPRQIRRILGQASTGEFNITTNQPRLDEELTIIRSMVNRLIAGIIVAAVITTAGRMSPLLGTLPERRQKAKEKDAM